MPASRAKAEGDRRSDASPLTAPRYLFASDAESLAKEAAAGLAECRQRLEEILARGRPRTIENLLVPYDRLLSGLSELQGQSRFLFDVHPNAAVRETADKWYQEAERFATDLALNRPLYDAFVDLDVSQEDPETKYAVIIPVFRYAQDPEVRRRLQWEHLNRGHPANLATLSKLMATRHELARVLGHESFADYIVQDKMIGSAKGIGDFLAKVRAASE